MKMLEKIIGLKEFKINKVYTHYKRKIIIDVETKNKNYCCPKCKNYTESINHQFVHQVRDNSISNKDAFLNINRKVFYCNRCTYSFTEKLDSVKPRRIYTNRFEIKVFEDCLENSITRAAKSNHLTYDCVRGIYERIADVCVKHLLSLNEEIEILGIDEISIKKGHKDFQAVISNVGKGYVIEVLKDRKKETVVKYLQTLPIEAKKRIVFVSMDMWIGYFNAVNEEIKDTTIVIDRFHVMSNLNKAITSCRRNIQKRMPKDIKDKYKGYRWTILKNEDNMTEEDLERIKKMEKDCPELEKLYNLKTEFQNIFNHTRKVERADAKLKVWENKIRKLNDNDMDTFLITLTNWRKWILNYFASNKVTNGFVEGMNNKIKLIKRIGYGYNNKINFRRRVLVECGYNNLSKFKKLNFLR